jgi:branched-chain amino acid transport system permease protein
MKWPFGRFTYKTAIIIAACMTLGLFTAYGSPSNLQIAPTGSTIIWIQVIVGGLLVGGIYVVAALGLTLVFGVTRIVNIVHGDFIILGAYVSFWLYTLFNIDPLFSMLISVMLFFAIGIPIQKFLMTPALKKGIDQPMIISFGLSSILQYSMIDAFTGNARGMITSWSGGTINLGIPVSIIRFVALMASIVVLVLLYLFLTRTYLGRAIRATSQEPESATLMGIEVDRVNLFSYGLSLGLAGIAGVFVGLVFGFDPLGGFTYLLKGFAVVVLGGVGSLSGALIGGLMLGVAESTGSYIIGAGYRDAISYIIFFIILLLRPTGILKRGKLVA